MSSETLDPIEELCRLVQRTTFPLNEKNVNLVEVGNYIAKEEEGLAKEAFVVKHPGTIFKLLFLANYLKFPYIRVIEGLKKYLQTVYNFSEVLYVDLFAGCGLVKVDFSTEVLWFPGSALLPFLMQTYAYIHKIIPKPLFDKIILCDLKARKLEKLRTFIQHKLSKAIDKAQDIIGYYNFVRPGECNYNLLKRKIFESQEPLVLLIDKDANEVAEWLTNSLNEESQKQKIGIHSLVFIDPDGPTDFKISSLAKICQLPGDVIMLEHPELFVENLLRWLSQEKCEVFEEKLCRAAGIQRNELYKWYNLACSGQRERVCEAFLSLRKETIENTEITLIGDRRSVKEIPLKTARKTYTLLYSTRKSLEADTEKSRWLNYVKRLGHIMSETSETGEIALDILKGKQKTLKTGPSQKTMHDFF